MLKLVLIGVWGVVVTAISTILASEFRGEFAATASDDHAEILSDVIPLDMMSVPLLRGGRVNGYLIIQLAFVADRSKLEGLGMEPAPFLVDAAFQAILSKADIDPARFRSGELLRLAQAVRDVANTKLGDAVVSEVLVQQLNYVRRDEIRTNWIGGGTKGP
jgi:hypothetical protein